MLDILICINIIIMDTIVYKLNAGDSLPGISKTIKIYSKLYKIPFIGRLFHKPLLNAWKFPKKVNMVKILIVRQ